jgi:acetylornithine deacetylase
MSMTIETASNDSMGIQPDRLRNLLRDLVNMYSPSGKEEEALEYAYNYLKRHGLKAIRQEVDENRYNLMVLPEAKGEIELCFVGHLDTVTAYDLDDYGFREEGEEVFGLGTADMKAGCAAMMEAFTVLVERGKDFPPVSLALVVDEEEDNNGAKILVRKYRFPWAVVGEPTNLAPCPGHYSYLEVLLRTQGRRAHSAMPELGQNAIEAMLKLLLHFTERVTSERHGLVYNIRDMSGFPGGFVVPDMCEAWLDLHLPPNESIDTLKTKLEQLMETARKDISGLDASLKFEDTYPGYKLPHDGVPVRKLKETYKRFSIPWEPQDFRSHSDGNVLWAAGVSPIILGPGRLEAAHTPEESVSFGQVVQAAQIYLHLALSL